MRREDFECSLQLANKFLYGEVGFRDFLGSRPSDLGAFRLFADDVEVALPTQLAGICIVNIPSFAGEKKRKTLLQSTERQEPEEALLR